MSSKRTVLSRPRTRLYDANYNIGESYYKPALDRLDRKYSGRPLSPPRQISALDEASERHARFFGDENLETSRRRAEKHIREENLFDSRGGRVSRAALLTDNFDNDFSEETAASIRRLRANKKVSIIDDPDLETASNHIKTHRLLDRSEKILDSVGINERSSRRQIEDELSKRKALKVTFEKDYDNEDLTRWTPLENKNNVASIRASKREEVVAISQSSGAALRAKQSKERLNDIEEEMAAMAEKQAAREARVARLKKLVAETEADSAEFELSQTRAERASARKERAIEY